MEHHHGARLGILDLSLVAASPRYRKVSKLINDESAHVKPPLLY